MEGSLLSKNESFNNLDKEQKTRTISSRCIFSPSPFPAWKLVMESREVLNKLYGIYFICLEFYYRASVCVQIKFDYFGSKILTKQLFTRKISVSREG